MIISRLILKNWRNFSSIDVQLGYRVFIVGPNASGKSNILDALRFLRDIAKSEGGGLQKAVSDRGGIPKIRCLAARRKSTIEILVHLSESENDEPKWKYEIGITREEKGIHKPIIKFEKVWSGDECILNRPNEDDKKDIIRKRQTHLEQLDKNEKFREIVHFFESVRYIHLVPQLIRSHHLTNDSLNVDDPFGKGFLERIAKTSKRIQESRLKRIGKALQKAVPQLVELKLYKDVTGLSHLEAGYEHWQPEPAKQNEEQFSDGTLRLIGLLWTILEGEKSKGNFLLLLEEPELSLHPGIIRRLPGLMWRFQKGMWQIFISTHSPDLFFDTGIGLNEILLLKPDKEGTTVEVASMRKDIKALLDSGFSIPEIVVPETEPQNIIQLNLFNGK